MAYRRRHPAIVTWGLILLSGLLAGGCAPLRLPAIDPSGAGIFLPQEASTTLAHDSLACFPEPAYRSAPQPPACAEQPGPPPATFPPGVFPSTATAPPAAACGAPADACGAAVPSCGVESGCGMPDPNCSAPEPGCAVAVPGCGVPEPACGVPAPAAVVPPPAPPMVRPTPLIPAGRLLVAPQRMIAPVGSEVILVAGLVSPRGDFEPRQPVEWTLAPSGVGHLVTTSSDRECLKPVWHHTAHRRSGVQAITYSSASPEVLTRGTPSPADDVSILRGQSWVTVTSPNEGSTHVGVVATKAANWDQRRQTATIYWVDVQWTLPPSAIVQSSQPHTLTTTVQRSSGKPLPGWIVRYEIQQPGASGFADIAAGIAGAAGAAGAAAGGEPNLLPQTSVEVVTDEAGHASVSLAPANKSSTVQIEIKIIRPSSPDDDLPRTVVGRGFTSVSWSAPDPQVTLRGPQTVPVGGTATYQAEIGNAGDVVAQNVTASATVPANMNFLQSEPPARVIGDRLEWPLGNVAPGERRPLTIHLRPERNAEVRFCVRVASRDSLQGELPAAEACVQTQVFSSALSVRLDGPRTAQVGEQIRYEIEIANTGFEPLTGVVIRNRLPAGLELPEQPGSVIERALPQPLAAGSSQKIELVLNVRQSGRLCQAVEVYATGGHTATASACVEVSQPAAPPPRPAEPAQPPQLPGGPTQPPAQPQIPPTEPKLPPEPAAPAKPSLRATIDGPLQSRVGQTVKYTMQVTNTGDTPLSRVRIVNTYEPSLYPRSASGGYDLDALRRSEVVWFVERLEPGETVTRETEYECLRTATAAWSRVVVETAEQVRTARETTTEILPAEPRPPAKPPAQEPPEERPPQEKPQPVEGELRVSIADTRDPIAVKTETTYIITVENARNVSDRKVAITVLLPPGLEFVRLRGPLGVRRTSDPRTIELQEIAELRAGESLDRNPIYLDVRGTQIGKHTVRVRVDSFRSAAPVEAATDTSVTISG